MSAYVGDSDELCDAVVKFAHTHANVTTRDKDLLASKK
jgi:hypothetical protein